MCLEYLKAKKMFKIYWLVQMSYQQLVNVLKYFCVPQCDYYQFFPKGVKPNKRDLN